MDIFLEIGLIIILASFFGFLAKLLKQPPIIGYILAGLILGPVGVSIINNQKTIYYFATLGIAFLLFTVGLDLDLTKIKKVGYFSILIGLGQMILTFLFTYLLSVFLNFNLLTSVYISLAITFSSTAIVVKLLSEKKDLNSLYGKITIGILLFQDLVAILAMLVLTAVKTSLTFETAWIPFLPVFIKGLGLFLLTILAGKYFLPHLTKYLAKSTELLFLGSIAWCFILAILSQKLDLSLEIGAFLAGVTLAATPYNIEISARIRPLRDFFITIFFATLGIQIIWASLGKFLVPFIIFSLFAILGKTIIILLIMKYLGFRKRVSFMTATSLAQISEFSFVIILLGYRFNHISLEIVSLITACGLITMLLSSYLIIYNDLIFLKLKRILKFFETKKPSRFIKELVFLPKKLTNHIILLGCHRMGYHILKQIKKLSYPVLVVDFDPDIINFLKQQGIYCLYGDIADPEILEKINLPKAKIIISTVPDLSANLNILTKAKSANKDLIVCPVAEDIKDALKLYQKEADYVILPHKLGGEHISFLLNKILRDKTNKEIIIDREKYIQKLKKISQLAFDV